MLRAPVARSSTFRQFDPDREMVRSDGGPIHMAAPQPIDEAAADPIHDHRPYQAPGHKVNRVLGILDQLDRANSHQRFTT